MPATVKPERFRAYSSTASYRSTRAAAIIARLIPPQQTLRSLTYQAQLEKRLGDV